MTLDLRQKIIISCLMIVALAATIYFVMDKAPSEVSTEEVIGQIHFKLYDESNAVVIDEMLNFYQDDHLYSILNRHFDLTCANQNYQPDTSCSYKFVQGYALLGIEDITTDWYSQYLSIYVNGSISVLGVSIIEPTDGDLIEIKVIDDE